MLLLLQMSINPAMVKVKETNVSEDTRVQLRQPPMGLKRQQRQEEEASGPAEVTSSPMKVCIKEE